MNWWELSGVERCWFPCQPRLILALWLRVLASSSRSSVYPRWTVSLFFSLFLCLTAAILQSSFPQDWWCTRWWNEACQRQGTAQVSEVEYETLSQVSNPEVLCFLREDEKPVTQLVLSQSSTWGFATLCELQKQLQVLVMAADVRAELAPVKLSISFTQVSMDAIIQCHMSKGKSMKFITSFSTLFQFMEPASSINPPNC